MKFLYHLNLLLFVIVLCNNGEVFGVNASGKYAEKLFASKENATILDPMEEFAEDMRNFTLPTEGISQNQGLFNLISNLPALGNGLNPILMLKTMMMSIRDDIDVECFNDLQRITSGLQTQQTWALAMLDAQFKIPSGVLNGDLKWLGSIDECEKVPRYMDVNETTLDTKYCRLTGKLNNVPALLKSLGDLYLGTCMPQKCSTDDVTTLMEKFINVTLSGMVTITTTECFHPEQPLDTLAIVTICLLGLLAGLVVVGTMYDILSIQLQMSTCNQSSKNSYCMSKYSPSYNGDDKGVVVKAVEKSTYDTKKDPISNGTKSDGITDDKTVMESGASNQRKRSIPLQMLLAFSAYTNGCKLLSTAQSSGSLGAIHGIRFLSMAWVILGHTYSVVINYSGNYFDILNDKVFMDSDFTFEGIIQAHFAVDSFFTISGILVSYLTLRELKKLGGAKSLNWFMFYFHRFWRLTPPYMLMLLTMTAFFKYIVNGPMQYKQSMDFCISNWWTNLLYVNNYVNTKERCFGHAWYLANDMQFYIISPIILVPIFYNVVLGGGISMLLLTISVTITGVIIHDHKYPSQRFFAPPGNDDDYFETVYIRSYTRLGPYIVGMVTGYVLFRVKSNCKIPKLLNIVLWTLCIGVCCSCVYGTYSDKDEHIFSAETSAAYMSLARTGWGVGISWIVFACATGNGGWINDLLSWSPFVPLGRLTYCAYLIHPFIMMIYYQTRTRPLFIGNFDIIYLFLGNICLAYGVAFLVSLVFESPMMGLEKAIFKKKK